MLMSLKNGDTHTNYDGYLTFDNRKEDGKCNSR